MSWMVFFFVPAVIFLGLVAPIWLILHYWTQSRMRKGLSDEDQQTLEQALQTASLLEQRVRHLETILDQEHPHWRNSSDNKGDAQHEQAH
ncbi:envelope stress response membrane protein PspB [Balneatrix alpica]|uniref:Envelope stress response membrane protein PspB n=1 Tax=Balneatrix alpica TaxID=75684 RepID=A0ABV5ZBN9_9GAMM|nr:envelope stress response membrane protein PspB [Balneatrix alpica]